VSGLACLKVRRGFKVAIPVGYDGGMRFTLWQAMSGMFWLCAAMATIYFCYLGPQQEYDLRTPLWLTGIVLVAWLGIGAEIGAAVGAIAGNQFRWAIAGLVTWIVIVIAHALFIVLTD